MLAVLTGRALTEAQPANLTAVFSLKEAALEHFSLWVAFRFALQIKIAAERPWVEVALLPGCPFL